MSVDQFVFGLGSPFGDDQLGWLVARLLRERGNTHSIALRNTGDLLEYFPHCRRAVIVDSCVSGAPVGSIFQIRWPNDRLVDRLCGSTHGIDLNYALRLAQSLRILPDDVLIYAVEINSSGAGDRVGDALTAAVHEVADQIDRELSAKVVENDA